MDSVVQGVIQECDLLFFFNTQTSSDHLPSIVDKYFSSLRSIYPGSILDRHAPVKEFAGIVRSFAPWYASLMKFPPRSELGDDFNENGIVLRELKTTIVTPIVNGMIADAKQRHYYTSMTTVILTFESKWTVVFCFL